VHWRHCDGETDNLVRQLARFNCSLEHCKVNQMAMCPRHSRLLWLPGNMFRHICLFFIPRSCSHLFTTIANSPKATIAKLRRLHKKTAATAVWASLWLPIASRLGVSTFKYTSGRGWWHNQQPAGVKPQVHSFPRGISYLGKYSHGKIFTPNQIWSFHSCNTLDSIRIFYINLFYNIY